MNDGDNVWKWRLVMDNDMERMARDPEIQREIIRDSAGELVNTVLVAENAKLRAALNLVFILLEEGMTWLEFIVFCKEQGWDSDALSEPYMGDDDDVEAPSFAVIVARELRRRLALAGEGDTVMLGDTHIAGVEAGLYTSDAGGWLHSPKGDTPKP